MPENESNLILKEISEDTIFIIGAGHFGNRAVRILSQESDAPLFVVDVDENTLSQMKGLPVKTIVYDGILFLVENYPALNPLNTIVPAVPVHLAFEWLKCSFDRKFVIKKTRVPEEIKPLLPYTWLGSEGSLLVSYADFVCPDDCPEPEFCTVTGERRELPLHDLLSRLDLLDFRVHVIRSHQLAPGLGGYKVGDLKTAAEKIIRDEAGRWLLGTACKCHGILTALEIHSVLEHENT